MAYADNNPQSGVWAELYPPYFNSGASKCLDAPGGTTSTGTTLQVSHCHGYASNGPPQRWVPLNRCQDGAGNVRREFMNLASHECLNIANSTGASGTRAVQDVCLGTDSGLWCCTPPRTSVPTSP